MRELLVYTAVGGSIALIGAAHILEAPPLWASLGGIIAAMPFSSRGPRPP